MAKKDEQQTKDVNAVTAKPFMQMTLFEKLKHVGKVIVFVLTFGFAFPNVFSE